MVRTLFMLLALMGGLATRHVFAEMADPKITAENKTAVCDAFNKGLNENTGGAKSDSVEASEKNALEAAQKAGSGDMSLESLKFLCSTAGAPLNQVTAGTGIGSVEPDAPLNTTQAYQQMAKSGKAAGISSLGGVMQPSIAGEGQGSHPDAFKDFNYQNGYKDARTYLIPNDEQILLLKTNKDYNKGWAIGMQDKKNISEGKPLINPKDVTDARVDVSDFKKSNTPPAVDRKAPPVVGGGGKDQPSYQQPCPGGARPDYSTGVMRCLGGTATTGGLAQDLAGNFLQGLSGRNSFGGGYGGYGGYGSPYGNQYGDPYGSPFNRNNPYGGYGTSCPAGYTISVLANGSTACMQQTTNDESKVRDQAGYLDGVRVKNGVCGLGIDDRFKTDGNYLAGYNRGQAECRATAGKTTPPSNNTPSYDISDAKVRTLCADQIGNVSAAQKDTKSLFLMLFRESGALGEAERKALGFDDATFQQLTEAKTQFDAGKADAVSVRDLDAQRKENVSYREGYACGRKIIEK